MRLMKLYGSSPGAEFGFELCGEGDRAECAPASLRRGDFNRNGVEDFALAVIDPSKQKNKFALLIFNGPFKLGAAIPAFMKSDLDLRCEGLFYGPPRPKRYRLLPAQFNCAPACFLFHAHGYRFRRIGLIDSRSWHQKRATALTRRSSACLAAADNNIVLSTAIELHSSEIHSFVTVL